MTELQRRAEYYLDLWSAWQHSGRNNLGFPRNVPMLVGAGSYWDSDDQCAKLDNAAAEATEAVIDGLPHLYRLAIYNAYQVAVIRFGRHMQEDLLALAKIDLMAGLKKRGME